MIATMNRMSSSSNIAPNTSNGWLSDSDDEEYITLSWDQEPKEFDYEEYEGQSGFIPSHLLSAPLIPSLL